jgi:hypothetical protein
MEQFGMMKSFRSSNELFYMNMDPMKSYKRRRVVRNISFKVEVTESNVIVSIESGLILTFVITMACLILPIIFLAFPGAFAPMVFGLCIYTMNYLVKLSAIDVFKDEVNTFLNELS